MMKKIIALCLIVAIAYAACTDGADCGSSATAAKGNKVIATTPTTSKYIKQCKDTCTASATDKGCVWSGKTQDTALAGAQTGCMMDPCPALTTSAACTAVTTTFPCVWTTATVKCRKATISENCQAAQEFTGAAAAGAAGSGAVCAALTALNCAYTEGNEVLFAAWPCVATCAQTTAGCKGCTDITDRWSVATIAEAAYDTAAALMKAACEVGDKSCAYTAKTATAKATCLLGDCAAASTKIACMKCTTMADCQLATKGALNEDCAWDTAGTPACKIGTCLATDTKFACGLCDQTACVLATKGALKGRDCVWQAAVGTVSVATCVRGDCGTSTSLKFTCNKCTTSADCSSATKGSYVLATAAPGRKCAWTAATTTPVLAAFCQTGDCGDSTSLKFNCQACSETDCVLATKGGIAARKCVWTALAGTTLAVCNVPIPVAAAAAASGFVKGLPVLSMIILAICLLAEF